MKTTMAIRGAALGTVIMCVLVLTTILFIAVSASVSHLRVVTAAESQEHARNLADSAIAKAIHGISETGSPSDIHVTINGVDGAGTLTFDPSVEPRGYSVYNIDGEATVAGARGRVVPPRTVHLVGKGQVGSAVSYVECLYYRPPFPDGLVATGPVKASALELYGIRRDEVYAGGDPGTIPPEDTMPGNLYSNYADGWDATEPTVRLLDQSDVSGSLGAVGTVSVDSTSAVGGELLPGSSPRPVADLDIPAKIDALRPNAIPYAGPDLDPDWFTISSGNLSVSGDLNLNGSALLVEGNLDVQGAVRGTGVILVDGEVRISDGGSDLVAGEQTAIACTKNFTLSAASPEGNYFKGLVYCEGDFLARDITVVGATVVNAEGNPDARGQAELENVRFIHNPGSVEVSMSAPKSYEIKYGTMGGDKKHHVSIAFVRTPSEDGAGFYYDLMGCLTRRSDALADSPGTWRTYGSSDFQSNWAWHIRSSRVEVNDSMSLSELHSHPEVQALAGIVGERFQQNENKPQNEVDWVELMKSPNGLSSLLYADLQQGNSTYNVTLNLNSLLGEFLSTSRVLLWRPLQEQDS